MTMEETTNRAPRRALPLLLVAALALPACEQQPEAAAPESAEIAAPAADEPAPLAAELQQMSDNYAANADPETKRIYGEGMQAVVESGVVEQAKTIGDDAPNFTLPDAAGDEVRLADLLAEGPVVLVWYRGGWCPYCSVTLRAYHEAFPRIEAAGGKLVAISPELPDHTAETVDENELDFIVLSDVGNRVAADYGVVFELTPEVHSRYNEAFGFDAHNGQDSGTLPLAATYVIDEDGVIRYAFLDADYSKRAEPSEVIAALEGLSG